MEDWAEIRRLHMAEGMAIKAIVRRTGTSRNAVRRALASDSPPAYSRRPKGSVVDAVEPAIRELLRGCPTMPATVIAERLGWQHGLTILKDRVRALRPYYLPPDPSSRTEYDPGQLVWDNEGAVGSWRRGKPTLTAEFESFRGSLGIGVHLCRPRDPEAKGLTERNNRYLETSFLPGRTFTGPSDFNTQMAQWLTKANGRHSRRIGCAPTARWATDRDSMLALPQAPPALG